MNVLLIGHGLALMFGTFECILIKALQGPYLQRYSLLAHGYIVLISKIDVLENCPHSFFKIVNSVGVKDRFRDTVTVNDKVSLSFMIRVGAR